MFDKVALKFRCKRLCVYLGVDIRLCKTLIPNGCSVNELKNSFTDNDVHQKNQVVLVRQGEGD